MVSLATWFQRWNFIERARLERQRTDVVEGRLTARDFRAGSSDGVASTAEASQGAPTSINLALPNEALLDELTRLDVSIASARFNYRQGNPLLDNLVAARARLEPELKRQGLKAIDTALEQYNNSIQTTRQRIAQLEQRFSLQPPLLRQFESLEQRLETAQANYQNYLRTREQFQLEIAQNNLPWRVISPVAVNPTPVGPRIDRGLLQALLLGLAGGVAAALLRDRLDHVFHTSTEIRQDLKSSLLGHVPYISFFEGVRREKRFLLAELDRKTTGEDGYQRFFYQEAFRNLYTSLRFLSTEAPLRSIALSSSVPGEGKSLVAVLLAKTLSEMGQRVLLVDADMRKPQMHHRLGLNNLTGLSNLLTDDSLAWREVLQPVADHPNWRLLSAGVRPPDPPRLLSSARMADLVGELADSGEFDLILYDTPPALGLADACLLAEHLDGIMLVVSLNRVDRSLPVQSIERIQASGVPLLGLISNSRTARQVGKSSPYGYGYGSGYGSTEDPAHDPGLAASYYQDHLQGKDGNGGTSPGAWSWQRLQPSRANFKRWRRSLQRWLDG